LIDGHLQKAGPLKAMPDAELHSRLEKRKGVRDIIMITGEI
jgi:hypothetical protein